MGKIGKHQEIIFLKISSILQSCFDFIVLIFKVAFNWLGWPMFYTTNLCQVILPNRESQAEIVVVSLRPPPPPPNSPLARRSSKRQRKF